MFSNKQFKLYKELIFNKTGINVSDTKREMFKTKIDKLMSIQNIDSYDEYYDVVASDLNGKYVIEFINLLTTNTTNFFREIAHFDYITKKISNILLDLPRIIANQEIRVWCSAGSSGEEAVTLAIVLKECLDENINIRILSTDIN